MLLGATPCSFDSMWIDASEKLCPGPVNSEWRKREDLSLFLSTFIYVPLSNACGLCLCP